MPVCVCVCVVRRVHAWYGVRSFRRWAINAIGSCNGCSYSIRGIIRAPNTFVADVCRFERAVIAFAGCTQRAIIKIDRLPRESMRCVPRRTRSFARLPPTRLDPTKWMMLTIDRIAIGLKIRLLAENMCSLLSKYAQA